MYNTCNRFLHHSDCNVYKTTNASACFQKTHRARAINYPPVRKTGCSRVTPSLPISTYKLLKSQPNRVTFIIRVRSKFLWRRLHQIMPGCRTAVCKYGRPHKRNRTLPRNDERSTFPHIFQPYEVSKRSLKRRIEVSKHSCHSKFEAVPSFQ